MTQDDVQREAVEAWLKYNKKGTFELSTGTGKTIAALHCLHTMPKRDGKVHLFLAEVTDRKTDLYNDILKYDKLFNTNTLNDYTLRFLTYQSSYRIKTVAHVGLIIADEIHNSLSPEYFKTYSNLKYDAIVGLSATIDRKTTYDIGGREVNKGQMLDSIAPVCYKFTINQSIDKGVGRKINVFVLEHTLDNEAKVIKAGNASKVFYQTEEENYKYWNKQFSQAYYLLDEGLKQRKMQVLSKKRADLLFKLPSKVIQAEKILNTLKGKTIIFGNDIDTLLKLTPNVVSSKNKDDINFKIRENFDNDRIQIIGSFKKLRQGANLKNLDNCFILSYYSSEGHLIQQIGRLRKNEEKEGNVIIFVTKNTQEEVWFNKIIADLTSFNIMYFNNINNLITKYEFLNSQN